MTEKERIITLLNQAADRHGVDRRYLHAIAHIESRHRHHDRQGRVMRSPAGALGVMQLMPATAQGLGVNPYQLEDNIEGGVRYFRQRLDLAGGDLPLALAMYYAGIGNVRERNARQWSSVKSYIHNWQTLVNSPQVQKMAGKPTYTPWSPEQPVAPKTLASIWIMLVIILAMILWVE